MKIKISEKELKQLKKVDIMIDLNKDYTDDEIEDVLEEIYFNEAINVEYDEKLSNRFADIADKIESTRRV